MPKYFEHKRASRSSKYQYAIIEYLAPDSLLRTFTNEEGYSIYVNGGHNERLMDLTDELNGIVLQYIDGYLTGHQCKILHLLLDGYTQMEIGSEMGINQSSVTKSLNGSQVYAGMGAGKYYGGSINKLRRLLFLNKRVMELLEELGDLKSGG